MMGAALLLLAAIPIVVYLLRSAKAATPSLQWPALADVLKFEYQGKPAPRLLGAWEGRHVSVDLKDAKVLVTMQLSQPSRLRVEIGPRAEVEARSGMIVPDRVQTGDAAFEARFLARCSERDAGALIFEPALRQRLLTVSAVDLLGAHDKVQWTLPALQEPEPLEHALEIMTAIAAEMERFPANANA